jgi:hypothetical protein
MVRVDDTDFATTGDSNALVIVGGAVLLMITLLIIAAFMDGIKKAKH